MNRNWSGESGSIVRVADVLEADTSAIADANGLLPGAFSYQWYRDGQPIAGAQGPGYYLLESDRGSTFSLAVWVEDRDGNRAGPLETASTAAVDKHY